MLRLEVSCNHMIYEFKTVDLIPNGRNIPVTETNKK